MLRHLISLFSVFIISASPLLYADGRVDLSDGIDISESPVVIDQQFDISFELKEHQGEEKLFDRVEVWIQDGSKNDLYMAAEIFNVYLPPFGKRDFEISTSLHSGFGREPGEYRAEVRAAIGSDVFVLDDIEDGNNGKRFQAVYPDGRVDLLSHSVYPTSSDVIRQDEPFIVSFDLTEHFGYPKRLDDLELWIQDRSGNDLFKAEDWGSETFNGGETKNYSVDLDIDSSRSGREPGTYRSIVRATVGSSTFNFNPNDSNAIGWSDPSFVPSNPFSFTVEAAEVIEGFVNLITPNVVFDPDEAQAGSEFSFNFSLQEMENAAKTFESVQVWLSDENDLSNRVYLIKDFGSQSFNPNQTKSFSDTVSLPSSPPIATETNYLIFVWGKVAGESEPFSFGYDGGFNPNFYLKAPDGGFVNLDGPIEITVLPPSASSKGFDYSFTLKEMSGQRKVFAAIRESVIFPDGTQRRRSESNGSDYLVNFEPSESKESSGGSSGFSYREGGRFGYLVEFMLPGSSVWEKFGGADNPQYFDIPGNDLVEIQPPEVACDESIDSDSDALPDCWETAGRYQLNGKVVLLPGAVVGKRDVYVFVDWELGNEPDDTAFDDVVEAFDRNNINLHIVKAEEGSSHNGGLVILSKDENGVCKQDWNGLIDVRDDESGKYFENKAMSHVYRYAFIVKGYLFQNSWYEDQDSCTPIDNPRGAAQPSSDQDVFGDSFVVSVNSRDEFILASVFMHELGHNLGLHHGGIIEGTPEVCNLIPCRESGYAADPNNNKPNHISIMNYAYLDGGISRRDGRRGYLDFHSFSSSDFYYSEVNERSLSEDMPLAEQGSRLGAMRGYFYCGDDGSFLEKYLGKWRSFWMDEDPDWNCNEVRDTEPYSRDINDDDDERLLLASENEWDNLYFAGGAIGGLAVGLDYDPRAPTKLTYAEFSQNELDDFRENIFQDDLSADIQINGYKISWPNDGWYQVQNAIDYTSVCEGGSECTVIRGRYHVINHTTGERYENIVVPGSIPESGPVVRNDTIIVPNDGWYQVQRANDYVSMCEGVNECAVPPGRYTIINHSTGHIHKNIIVGESQSQRVLLSSSNLVTWPNNTNYVIIKDDITVCTQGEECRLLPGTYHVVNQDTGHRLHDLEANDTSISSGVVATGTKIYWPQDGWYGVYDYAGTTVCQGTPWCEVDPGYYRVVNHTTDETYDNVLVSRQSDLVNAPSITLNWPNMDWYQVLDSDSYESLCEGRVSCRVEPGSYVVINHTTGERFRDVVLQ